MSYAEGYRAPSITETLIAGAHATGGGPAFFTCADGTSGLFCFKPNPDLRPEVGKNKEVGLNLKYDNIFSQGDSFRGKFNAFRNDLEDYIEVRRLTPQTPTAFRTRSTAILYSTRTSKSPTSRALEAETIYDAGAWFVGVAGQIQRGYNDDTNVGLVNVQPNKIATTLGLRSPDRTVTLAGTWVSVASNQHIDQTLYIPKHVIRAAQPLFDLAAAPRTCGSISVSTTCLDRYYRPYAVAKSTSTDGTTQNDLLWTAPPPGIVYKAAMRIHFGAM